MSENALTEMMGDGKEEDEGEPGPVSSVRTSIDGETGGGSCSDKTNTKKSTNDGDVDVGVYNAGLWREGGGGGREGRGGEVEEGEGSANGEGPLRYCDGVEGGERRGNGEGGEDGEERGDESCREVL